MAEKFKLTSEENQSKDSQKIKTEFEVSRLVNNIYNEVVVRIANEIKEDVIKKVKADMMKDKKLTRDIQEVIKQRLIEKMLPKDPK